MQIIYHSIRLFSVLFFINTLHAKNGDELSRFVPIGKGWSQTSVNATIFRKNSVVSSENYQFVAFYDTTAHVVLARRKHGTDHWEIQTTQYRGNVANAHNIISIMVDGNGYLHVSWDQHNQRLRYARSLEPEGLELGPTEPMIGTLENSVTYPEFYRLADGNLLFVYRDGGSGRGNMVMNHYSIETKKWQRLHNNLIDGEGKRNPYWQMFVDRNGVIHVSWVWRSNPDVRSNHNMSYAKSKDGGLSWSDSKGNPYKLPIVESNAEIVKIIPKNSNLINQTSMVADRDGNPYIATYFRAIGDDVTQFHVIYLRNGVWKSSIATQRTLDFDLGGIGSRSIPISRPQLLLTERGRRKTLYLIYRDEEMANHVVLARSRVGRKLEWQSTIISPFPVDRWEPSYDTELMRSQNKLHLFFQKVGQGQGETSVDMEAQVVGILEIDN